MRSAAREHYDTLLAEHYSRMFGDFEAKVAEQRTLLERWGVTAQSSGGLAVDLGCGSGFQSVALARLGYRVLAIDFSRRLLDELAGRARGGDTLAHLEREADLDRVFQGVAGRLGAGGRLVLSFRDLSVELRDLDRVISLGAWDDLVMTCFLEYEASTVKVHDLLWVRQPDGWRFRKGMYRKLRLAPAQVVARLIAAGFAVERHDAPGGMVALVGVRVGPRSARQRRHGRISSGRGKASGGAKTARYPSAGARRRKSTSR